MSCKSERTVYFTMVLHPMRGWMRVGNAYATRSAARGWLPFVRGYWRGLRAKVAPLKLRFVDGKLDDATLEVLSNDFNIDPPKTAQDEQEGGPPMKD